MADTTSKTSNSSQAAAFMNTPPLKNLWDLAYFRGGDKNNEEANATTATAAIHPSIHQPATVTAAASLG
eukprot:2092214-Ditylum_brightwellii.AAC.1